MGSIRRSTLEQRVADGVMDVIEWITPNHARVRVQCKDKYRVKDYHVKDKKK